MAVMFAYTVVWSADGWMLGVEPAWNGMRVGQFVTAVIFLAGIVSSRRVAQIIAILWLLSSLATGFGARFEPGAFGPG